MERLTTDKKVAEMGMYELAHNACYYKDGNARYRDFEMDMDARDFARNLTCTLTSDELPLDDDSFEDEIMENLIYDPFSDIRGLIALFYRNLWEMADLRENLKEYESIGTVKELQENKRFLEFLHNHILPNEMEQYLSMYRTKEKIAVNGYTDKSGLMPTT